MHNCPFMHNCYSAGAYMHWHCIICTGTVALPFNILMFPFIILMFYLYGIKSKYFTPFLSLLSLASRNTMPQLSPYFIPELPLIFSLRLIIAHCHHQMEEIILQKWMEIREKIAPKPNRDTSKLIHPPHRAAKTPNRSHNFLW